MGFGGSTLTGFRRRENDAVASLIEGAGRYRSRERLLPLSWSLTQQALGECPEVDRSIDRCRPPLVRVAREIDVGRYLSDGVIDARRQSLSLRADIHPSG